MAVIGIKGFGQAFAYIKDGRVCLRLSHGDIVHPIIHPDFREFPDDLSTEIDLYITDSIHISCSIPMGQFKRIR